MDMRGISIISSYDGVDRLDTDLYNKIPKQYHEFLLHNLIKDKISHPYSYSPFLIYFNEETKKEATSTIYTDRLPQWDFKKHDRLCLKHFDNKGQKWDERDPEKIEAFLSDWTGKKIILIANIQYVNMSSGYPLWRLDFCEDKAIKKKDK